MRNHNKLYRTIAASLLMLLTGLVVAPTVVTAGFQASTKKVDAHSSPTEPETQSVQPQIAQQSSRAGALTQSIWPAFCPRPIEQSENQDPISRDQPGTGAPTTFAIADFEPAHGGGAVSPRGATGVDVAAAEVGVSNISKSILKPNSLKAGSDQPGNSQPNTTGAPDNNSSDSHPAAGGDQKDKPVPEVGNPTDVNQPPSTELVGNAGNRDDRPHASVPEPSSLGLLVAGMIGLALARRRG